MNDTGSRGFIPKRKSARRCVSPKAPPPPDEYADESERHPLVHDHVTKIRGLCAERHADAKFLCALLNGVGHHAIYADRRHEKAGKPKDGQQQHYLIAGARYSPLRFPP
jgi:hypothetical protein